MRRRLAKSGLLNIADRLDAGERLALADGVKLFECQDLLAVGWLVVYFAPSHDSSLAMRMPTR